MGGRKGVPGPDMPGAPPPSQGGSGFDPHSDGDHIFALVDVVDLGMRVEEFQDEKTKKWKKRASPKIALVFVSNERREDGSVPLVQREFTHSAHEKSALRIFMEQWFPGQFDDEALREKGYPWDKLFGAGAELTIKHVRSKKHADRVYANIAGVRRVHRSDASQVPDAHALWESGDYVRPDFLEDRKAEYATEYEAWLHEQEHAKPAPATTARPAKAGRPAPFAKQEEVFGQDAEAPDPMAPEAEPAPGPRRAAAAPARAGDVARRQVARPAPAARQKAAPASDDAFEDFAGGLDEDDDDLPFD